MYVVTVEAYQTEQMETQFKLFWYSIFKKGFGFNFSNFSENFAGTNFCEQPENYDFAGINFATDQKIRRIAKVSTRETFYL